MIRDQGDDQLLTGLSSVKLGVSKSLRKATLISEPLTCSLEFNLIDCSLAKFLLETVVPAFMPSTCEMVEFFMATKVQSYNRAAFIHELT